MKMFTVIFILFPAQLLLAAPTANDCRRFFNYQDGTNELISYIESISQLPSMSQYLPNFYQAVAQGELENPISVSAARVNAELHIHRSGINKIIEQSFFDLQKLMAWAVDRGAQVETARQVRSATEAKTKATIRPFKMIPIDEMHLMVMDGPVTQHMWYEIFGEVPSDLEPEDIDTVQVNGVFVDMAPNHPVTGITFWSAINYANEMSKHHHLSEAYDLSSVKDAMASGFIFKEDDFQKFRKANSPELVAARDGLRLPTVEEYQRLAYDLALYNGRRIEELTEEERVKLLYSTKIHSVGSKLRPAVIGSHIINDLLGSISFYTSNVTSYDLRSGRTQWRVNTVGHSCYKDWSSITSRDPEYEQTNIRHRGQGIILVRTVKP